MRIAIDVREACATQPQGKGVWTFGFVSALIERKIPLLLLSNAPLPVVWNQSHVEACIIPRVGIRWHASTAASLRKRNDVSCFVSTTSYILPLLLTKRIPSIVIVHDLIAFEDATHAARARVIERITLPRALQRAACVCTVSETTTQALKRNFPGYPRERICTIFAGPPQRVLPRTMPDGSTVLCIGTLSPRKNQLRLIQAFTMLPKELRSHARLLLVGASGWKDADIRALAANTQGCMWLGFVSHTEVQQLLERATVLALPSLDEGFGLPLLEAFARGIPILTSPKGSLREVAQDAAYYIDPLSVKSIAHGLEMLLQNPEKREELIRRGFARAKIFSWENTVHCFLKGFDRYCSSQHCAVQ
jgi:glycosyltransferase involved in cell wall biosynthesis